MQPMFTFLFPFVILNGAPEQCFLHSILQRAVQDREVIGPPWDRRISPRPDGIFPRPQEGFPRPQSRFPRPEIPFPRPQKRIPRPEFRRSDFPGVPQFTASTPPMPAVKAHVRFQPAKQLKPYSVVKEQHCAFAWAKHNYCSSYSNECQAGRSIAFEDVILLASACFTTSCGAGAKYPEVTRCHAASGS